MALLCWRLGKLAHRQIIVKDFSELVIPLHEAMRQHVESAMILCCGRRDIAARKLGITKKTLYSYLRKFDVPLRNYRYQNNSGKVNEE